MLKKFGTVALVVSGLVISHEANATTYQFVEAAVTGPSITATEIGVGPTDIVFAIGSDAHLNWLKRSWSCSGICAETRSWQSTSGTADHLSVDLFGYAWTHGLNCHIYYGAPDSGNFFHLYAGVFSCTKSFAMGFIDFGFGQDWPFDGNLHSVPPGPYYGRPSYFVHRGAGDTELAQDSITYVSATSMTHSGFVQVDTGESAVTFFTIDGTTDQVPWITHNTGALNKMYAWYDGSAHGAPFPSRVVNGRRVNFSVDSATDHWVAADNCVWQWVGDAYANGNWQQVACAVDSQLMIKQIAYAPQIHTGTVGTVGPSQLWVLGQDGKVYVMQAIPT